MFKRIHVLLFLTVVIELIFINKTDSQHGLVIENSNQFVDSDAFDGKYFPQLLIREFGPRDKLLLVWVLLVGEASLLLFFTKSIFSILSVDICKNDKLKKISAKISIILKKFVKIELNELCSSECFSQSQTRSKRQTSLNVANINDATIKDSSFFASKKSFFY